MHEVGISAGSASPAQTQMARTPDAEIELIERVCSGETQLFYELISPYERRVYVAAVSVLQNEADAEEAALPFWMGLAMLSAWSAMAVRLTCQQDLASA